MLEPSGEAAAQLEAAVPGADLAYLLEVIDMAAADDYALVEVVAAWQRMASWAYAGAARAAAQLAQRAAMSPGWAEGIGSSDPNVAGEELAFRLGCSRRQGRLLVRDGRAFAGALGWTGTMLAGGELDMTKARVLVDALDDLPVPLALDVQDAVLPGAPRRTPQQLARDVARALVSLDPDGACDRHEAAARGRRVDKPKVLADGMAGLWAVLPATDAVRLDSALDALARGGRAAGDPRTLDQLRADLLVELTTGEVEGTAAWLALAGGPAGGAGACACGAVASAPAPDAAGLAEVGRDAGGEALGGAGDGAFGGAGDGASIGSGVGPARFRGTSSRTEIRVTVSLSTLLCLDDAPADLAGYGPITAEAARALAEGGVWRRIVTDPMSGQVLDVGRTRYRPPEALARHVQVRDGTCASPVCSAPAESCDLDHTIEYHGSGEGTTSPGNLGPLCRRDHRIKTDGGFGLRQVEPGHFEWLTPTGHRYRVIPGTGGPSERLPGTGHSYAHLESGRATRSPSGGASAELDDVPVPDEVPF